MQLFCIYGFISILCDSKIEYMLEKETQQNIIKLFQTMKLMWNILEYGKWYIYLQIFNI